MLACDGSRWRRISDELGTGALLSLKRQGDCYGDSQSCEPDRRVSFCIRQDGGFCEFREPQQNLLPYQWMTFDSQLMATYGIVISVGDF